MPHYASAIKKRTSVRTYNKQGLNHSQIDGINQAISSLGKGPMGSGIRVELVNRNQVLKNHKVKLGTYGFIRGAHYFLCGCTVKKKRAEIDYGYVFEKLLLDLTSLDMGTCWLGGTFNRSKWGTLVSLRQDEFIPAISPVGIPSHSKALTERLIRQAAKANRRKPWSELFMTDKYGIPLSKNDAGKFEPVLEMVRLAPSASNKQPWRLLKAREKFHLILCRTPGYGIKSVDLQMIDMGIAMFHFEAVARENKLSGSWKVDREKPLLPKECEYIATWRNLMGIQPTFK